MTCSSVFVQAVAMSRVLNNTAGGCLPGYAFCGVQQSLTSVTTYSADPYTVDALTTKV